MNKALENLSIIDCFHDEGRSVLSAFMPLVEYAVFQIMEESKSDYFTLTNIQEEITKRCSVEVPIPILRTLFKELEELKKVRRIDNEEQIQVLSSFAEENKKYLLQVGNKNREINKFIKKFQEFSQEQLTDDEVKTLIYDFVAEYKASLDVKVNSRDFSKNDFVAKFKEFGNFIKEISESESELFAVFKEIFCGQILCGLLVGGEDLSELKLQNIAVILDANFLFRLLDLQNPFFHKIAKEILQMLTSLKIKICIFEETLGEMTRTLKFYQEAFASRKEELKGLWNEKINNIHGIIGAFFRRGFTNSQIEGMISNFSDSKKFLKMVDFSFSPLNLKNLKTTPNEEKIQSLYELKLERNNIKKISSLSSNDDKRRAKYYEEQSKYYISIIDKIKELRGGNKYDLGSCRYVFLTTDGVLSQFNKIHTPKEAFPETITEDRFVASLAFVSPKFKNVQLQQVISIFSASNYVDLNILDKFRDKIKEKSNDGCNSNDVIARVFNNQKLFSKINEIYDEENGGFDDDDLTFLIKEQRKHDDKKQREDEENRRTIENQGVEIVELEKSNKDLHNEVKDLKSRIEKIEEEKNEKELILKKIETEKKLKKYNWFYVLYFSVPVVLLGTIATLVAISLVQNIPLLSIVPSVLSLASLVVAIVKGKKIPWNICKFVKTLKEEERNKMLVN
ncbi:MAG: hypothetical protein FWC11_01295 [Firmicutes bacterium]|nr:hypothetical protein [Bacillota bacterium]MCL2255476.1 hypothetical protein [Bacillota bacterium]